MQTKVGSFTLNTTTGLQSITGVGFQPAIVLFSASIDATDGASYDYCFGAGISSASQICVGVLDNDNVTVSSSRRWFRTASCIAFLNAGGTITENATFSSMDADGFTINVSTAGAARQVQYLAIGGTDVSVKIGKFLSPTIVGLQAITGVGFQPKLVMIFGSVDSNIDNSSGVSASIHFGAGTSALSRFANLSFSRYSGGNDSFKKQLTDNIVTHAPSFSTLLQADLFSLDADGFTLNWTSVATAAKLKGYIAFGGTASYAVGALNEPTATGNFSDTSLSFQPSALLFTSFQSPASTVSVNNGGLMFGFSKSTTERNTTAFYAVDASNPADISHGSSNALSVKHISGGTPTVNFTADFVSMNANGFTLNATTVDATARQLCFVAFGSAAAGGGDVLGAAALSTTATLSPSAALDLLGAASLAASATLTPVPALDLGAIASLLASAGITATGTLAGQVFGAAVLNAVANLMATGSLSGQVLGAATLNAVASLSPKASLDLLGSASLSTLATLSAAPTLEKLASASLSLVIQQVSSGTLDIGGAIALDVLISLNAAGVLDAGAQASLQMVLNMLASGFVPGQGDTSPEINLYRRRRLH